MTITEFHTYFDILCDKYGNPYFTTAEKDLLFNRATLIVLEEIINSGLQTQQLEEVLYPLILRGYSTMNASGVIPFSTIEAQLTAAYGQNVVIYRILSVSQANSLGTIIPVRYRSYNKLNYSNTFKTPSATVPVFSYIGSSNLQFLPVNQALTNYITIIKKPLTVSTGGPVNSDMPEALHNAIVHKAVDLAGIGSRDQELVNLNQPK